MNNALAVIRQGAKLVTKAAEFNEMLVAAYLDGQSMNVSCRFSKVDVRANAISTVRLYAASRAAADVAQTAISNPVCVKTLPQYSQALPYRHRSSHCF